MNYLFNNIMRDQHMIENELLPIGEKVDLSKIKIPLSDIANAFKEFVYLYDADTLEFLALNQKSLNFFNIESQQELEGKDIYYLEKRTQERNPKTKIQIAKKVTKELEETLSAGHSLSFMPHECTVNAEGFCVFHPCIRTPIKEGKKIRQILTFNTDFTRYQSASDLYEKYKKTYPENDKKRNKIFLKYLGLPTDDLSLLTTREIETLIALSQYRTNKEAADAIDITTGTIGNRISDIKLKLGAGLNQIILHFTDSNKRKF